MNYKELRVEAGRSAQRLLQPFRRKVLWAFEEAHTTSGGRGLLVTVHHCL